MRKTGHLNRLFQRWTDQIEGYDGKFKKDGIINDYKYEKAKKKILFIAKEANDPEQKEADFRTWWKDDLKYQFSIRLAEWAYGILHDFPDYSEVGKKNSLLECLQSTAFMNLKKSGGGSTADNKNIIQTVKEESRFIRKEIEIIDPQIIIGCFSREGWWKLFLDDVEFTKHIDGVGVGTWQKAKVVNFFHPSYRGSSAMSYVLLREVMKSI